LLRGRGRAPARRGRQTRDHQPVTDQVATFKARIELEFDLAAELERSAGHRPDFERECDRADRMVTAQNKLIAELEALRALLEAAHALGPPGHHSDMARDILARALELAAHDWLTSKQSNRRRNPT
jgi:hypothetical protein